MSEIKISRTKKSRKKNGRPELGAEKKTERLNVMASREDREKIQAKAASQKVSVSSFLLDLGLSRKIIPPPPAVNLQTLLEINQAGRNLNTLVVLLRKQRNFDWRAIEITVDELQNKIAEVGALLIGKNFCDEAEAEETETNSTTSLNGQNFDAPVSEIRNVVM